jgi:hypothetical protein
MILSRRHRVLGVAVAVLVSAWLVALVGARWAKANRMTASKVTAYLAAHDLRQLSGEARARAIRGLIDQLNALPFEERRRVRLERRWRGWFDAMTPEEQGMFLEATMPAGLKQMLASFEEMPAQNRRAAVDEAVKRLQAAQREVSAEAAEDAGAETNAPPELDPELQQRLIQTGLKTYYSDSSARSKAELAPLLEEIQRMMESGRFFRRRGAPGGSPHE